MAPNTPARIPWRGEESAREIERCLEEGQDIELYLPLDLHHVLFAKLCKEGADRLRLEAIDLEDGTELLGQVARIDNLHPLSRLLSVVERLGAVTTLQSPSPCLRIRLPR